MMAEDSEDEDDLSLSNFLPFFTCSKLSLPIQGLLDPGDDKGVTGQGVIRHFPIVAVANQVQVPQKSQLVRRSRNGEANNMGDIADAQLSPGKGQKDLQS